MLPLVVPHLSEDVTFDDVLEAIQTWDPQSLLAVMERGIAIVDVIQMRRNGISGPELDTWRSVGVPAAAWKDWMERNIAPVIAATFDNSGVDPATARQWLDVGLSASEAVSLIVQDVSIGNVSPWLDARVAPADAVAFIGGGIRLEQAREWIRSAIAAPDAVDFVRGGVSLATAVEWVEETELSAADIVDFIQKEVSLEQALEFEERGLQAHQVTRTKVGLQLDIDPWQKDPADQLPSVMTPGPIELTLWTDAFGNGPQASDVSFVWDGNQSASWYEDISVQNAGLSVMSSSPGHGVLAWPNGKDVILTYTWDDFSVEGYDTLTGMAPSTSQNGIDACSPKYWIQLGYSVIDFMLQYHGSGEARTEYLDTVDDVILNLDEMFYLFLTAYAALPEPDFGKWLEEISAAGRYKIVEDE